MNVKSKFDTEEEDHDTQRGQYMRGMCSTPLAMIEETARLDMSNVKAPKFIQKIFRAIGWKTRPDSES